MSNVFHSDSDSDSKLDTLKILGKLAEVVSEVNNLRKISKTNRRWAIRPTTFKHRKSN
jgi:hypothetical protein